MFTHSTYAWRSKSILKALDIKKYFTKNNFYSKTDVPTLTTHHVYLKLEVIGAEVVIFT